ncbi:hypothetical protein IFM12275_41140 [Nocardia sputorum]|uniref:hypothetical protein n=1 Tax=Nocardia TaxID=1817 RepID=UPI0024567589|nr:MULTISPECIES: hypothetical protein [Nocardia]BDT94138.1 hypothetical protein IFM12275_41140 [Nocardia sputorum]
MVTIVNDTFGYGSCGSSIGQAWLGGLRAVMDHGETTFDEGRRRLSLQGFRIKAAQQATTDPDIERYGDKENITAILDLTFRKPTMVDIDVNPSFGTGAKSYHARLTEGRMLEFAAKRLGTIPESKKAVVVFPTYDDYRAVLENPWNDYLPCIVAVQFRMTPNGGSGRYRLNSVFFARSLDIYQKGLGNMIAITAMAEIVAEAIQRDTGREISLGFIDGFITDVHVYEECLSSATSLLAESEQSSELASTRAGEL